MFKINSILHPVLGEESIIDTDHIVVFIQSELDRVFLFNLVKSAFPFPVPFSDICENIKNGSVEVMRAEWSSKTLLADEFLSENEVKKYRDRYAAIEPLISDLEILLVGSYGKKIISERACNIKCTSKNIYNLLYIFFREGQRIKGMLATKAIKLNRPDRKILVKQGRKAGSKKNPIDQGVVLSEFDIRAFEWAANRFVKKSELSLKQSYQDMRLKFYAESKIRLPDGRYNVELAPKNKTPTFDQYSYWFHQKSKFDKNTATKKKLASSEYEKDLAGRVGADHPRASYPGEEIQLDETPYDEILVSDLNGKRNIILGKATVYVTKDSFCRGVTGLYVTVSNPSYSTARMALFNTFRDKVEFCAELGIDITQENWPMKGVGNRIFVDNAEYANKLSESCITDLGLTVQFGRSYRGDDKGLVENAFEHFKKILKGKSLAHQTKTMRSIDAKVARRKASLTINELYLILITYILHYNENQYLENYPLTAQMIRDGVEPYPNQIYAWGLKNRPGALRDTPSAEIYMNTLEVGEVSVHKEGIYFLRMQLWYDCDWTIANALQDQRVSRNKAIKFQCRYIRQCASIIYLVTPDGLKPASLSLRDQAYVGLSFEEISSIKTELKREQNQGKDKRDSSYAGVFETVESILTSAAKSKVAVSAKNISAQSITENRAVESMRETVAESRRFLDFLVGEIGSACPVADVDSEAQSTTSNMNPDVFYGGRK